MLRTMKSQTRFLRLRASRVRGVGACALCVAVGTLSGCRLPADASASADATTGTAVAGGDGGAGDAGAGMSASAGGAEVAPAVRRSVPSGGYSGEGGYFDLARDVLRDEGFILERVDAQGGVITTRPKTTAGLATPWHSDQSTLSQEIDDLASRQQRTVRITFAAPGVTMFDDLRAATTGSTAPGSTGSTGSAAVADGAAGSGEMTMTVRVILERMSRPGWRVNTTSVRLSTYSIDTDLRDRGVGGQYAVAREDDQDLAERLANEIVLRQGRLARAQP